MSTPPQMEAKVVLLGSQSVGKTCCVLRYIHRTFSDEIRNTVGASFLAKKLDIDGKTLKMQIWDTAGQERFRSMAPIYYRGAHAALIVFDITNEGSFEELISWVKELKTNHPGEYLLYIVGNKADLQDQRVVPRQKAENYAASIKATYWETSAKDDIGLNDLFNHVGNHLLSQNLTAKPSQPSKVTQEGLKKPAEKSWGC